MTKTLARQILAAHTAICMHGVAHACDADITATIRAAETAANTIAGVRDALRAYWAPRQYGFDWGANSDRPQMYVHSKQLNSRAAVHWHPTPDGGVYATGHTSNLPVGPWGVAVAALVGDRKALHATGAEVIAEMLDSTLARLRDADEWDGLATSDAVALLRTVAAGANMHARPRRLLRITHQGRTWEEEVPGTSAGSAMKAARSGRPGAEILDLGPADPELLALVMQVPDGGLLEMAKWMRSRGVADEVAQVKAVRTRRKLGL